MYDISRMPNVIDIGFTGEESFRKVEIDMSAWMALMPDGTPSIVHIRPGEGMEDAYIAETTFTDNILTWEITLNDLGGVEGVGSMQVWLEKTENTTLEKRGKSIVIATMIHGSISDPGDTIPPARTALLNLTAEAEGLPAGSDPTAELEHDGYYGDYNLKLGIPKGDKGDKGDQGDPAPADQVQPAVNAYLAQVITNPDSPPLDRSLTSSSSATPADITGNLKSALNNDGYSFLAGGTGTSNSSVTITIGSDVYALDILPFTARTGLQSSYYVLQVIGTKTNSTDVTILSETYSQYDGNRKHLIIDNSNGIYVSLTIRVRAENGTSAIVYLYKDLQSDIDHISNKITPVVPGWHYGYKTNTGATGGQSATDRQYSDFILCPGGSTVKYVAETNHATIAGICFYNESGEFISGISNAGTIGTEQTATAPDNAWYCVISTKTDMLNDSYAKITNSAVETIKGINRKFEITKYISPDGNDTNTGTSDSPYKSLNKAITSGASVVYAKAGVYEQPPTVTMNNKTGFEFYVLHENPSASTKHKPKAVFENGYTLSTSTDSTTGLLVGTHTFAETSNWYKVFVSQTLPISPTGMQSETYNAILWECDTANELNDIKLKPVLTLAGCQDEAGTFYYDHSAGKIYINPNTSINNPTFKYLRFEAGTLVYISNSRDVIIDGMEIKHAPDYAMQVIGCNNVSIRETKFTHTAYRNGIMVTKGNAELINCESIKMTGDGFGIATQGTANLINCHSHHNYDDGVSHHDGSVGYINGGHYHHNGKGGIASPYSGAKVDIYNAMLDHNNYGIYAGTGDDECIVSGCAIVNNVTAILNTGYTLHCYNNVFSGNTNGITGNGNTVVYGT